MDDNALNSTPRLMKRYISLRQTNYRSRREMMGWLVGSPANSMVNHLSGGINIYIYRDSGQYQRTYKRLLHVFLDFDQYVSERGWDGMGVGSEHQFHGQYLQQ